MGATLSSTPAGAAGAAGVPTALDGLFAPKGTLSARQVKGRFWGAVSLTCRRLGQIGAHHTEGNMVQRICYRHLLVNARGMVFGHNSPEAAAFLAVPPSQTPTQQMDSNLHGGSMARKSSKQPAHSPSSKSSTPPAYTGNCNIKMSTSGADGAAATAAATASSVTAAFGGSAPTNCHRTPTDDGDDMQLIGDNGTENDAGHGQHGLSSLPPLQKSAGAAALQVELHAGRRPSLQVDANAAPCTTSELLAGNIGELDVMSLDDAGLGLGSIQIVAPASAGAEVDAGSEASDDLSDAGSADSGGSSLSDASTASFESVSSDGSYPDHASIATADSGAAAAERKKSKPWFKRGARKIRARLFGKRRKHSGTVA